MLLPGESQGTGSLVGYRLRGHRESVTTKVTWQLQQQQLFVIQWTVAYEAPLSMEFSRQQYCRGSSGPRNQIWVLHIVGGFFTICITREAQIFLPLLK